VCTSTPTYLLSDLMALYQKNAMYAYMTCGTFVCFEAHVVSAGVCTRGVRGLFVGGFVPVVVALVAMYYTAKRIEREKLNAGLLHIICYGGKVAFSSRFSPSCVLPCTFVWARGTGLGGTFGGQSVTLAKSTVELIKSSLAGSDAFLHLQSYVIVIAMAVGRQLLSRYTAVLWLVILEVLFADMLDCANGFLERRVATIRCFACCSGVPSILDHCVYVRALLVGAMLFGCVVLCLGGVCVTAWAALCTLRSTSPWMAFKPPCLLLGHSLPSQGLGIYCDNGVTRWRLNPLVPPPPALCLTALSS
jgi:hypothetical protein